MKSYYMYGNSWNFDSLEPKVNFPIVRQRHDPKDLEKNTFSNSGSLQNLKLQQVAGFLLVAPCLEKIFQKFFLFFSFSICTICFFSQTQQIFNSNSSEQSGEEDKSGTETSSEIQGKSS